MRIVPESGGLEYGPPTGPWIDVIPGSPRGFGAAPLTEAEAVSAVRSGLLWEAWTAETSRAADRVSGVPVTRGMRGVVGHSERGDLAARFLYRPPGTPVDALRAIEDIEPAIPPELIGAALAAAQSEYYPTVAAPQLMAEIAASLPARSATRYTGGQIAAVVRQYVADLASGRVRDWPDAAWSAVDWCRFLSRLSGELWQPATRRLMIPAFLEKEDWPLYIALLAAIWLLLRERPTVQVAGIALPVERGAQITAWPQVLLWDQGEITPAALRFLTGGSLREAMPSTDQQPHERENPYVADRVLAAGLVTGLLREADEQAVYVPGGAFILSLPDDYPLRSWGVEDLSVWAEPDRMWVGVRDAGRRMSVSFLWRPGGSLPESAVQPECEPLLLVTLAALWRDLRVAGERAVPARKSAGGPAPHHPRPNPQPANPKLVLPRTRWVLRGEHRTWSTPAERETIARRAHGVRGHLRRLHSDWRAAENAAALASEYGLALPDGHTFVRPHIRGEHEADQHQTIVIARGLATVMTLL